MHKREFTVWMCLIIAFVGKLCNVPYIIDVPWWYLWTMPIVILIVAVLGWLNDNLGIWGK